MECSTTSDCRSTLAKWFVTDDALPVLTARTRSRVNKRNSVLYDKNALNVPLVPEATPPFTQD